MYLTASPPVPLSEKSSPPLPPPPFGGGGPFAAPSPEAWGLPAGDRPDDEKGLRPRRDRVGKRGIRRVVGQVPLARKESQKRPSLRRDVVADRPSEHGIAGLERVEHRAPSDPPGNVELHLAFDLGQRPQVRRERHADHGSR